MCRLRFTLRPIFVFPPYESNIFVRSGEGTGGVYTYIHTHAMNGRIGMYDHKPSHPYNDGVGVSPTKQALLEPSDKRRGGGKREGRSLLPHPTSLLLFSMLFLSSFPVFVKFILPSDKVQHDLQH